MCTTPPHKMMVTISATARRTNLRRVALVVASQSVAPTPTRLTVAAVTRVSRLSRGVVFVDRLRCCVWPFEAGKGGTETTTRNVAATPSQNTTRRP